MSRSLTWKRCSSFVRDAYLVMNLRTPLGGSFHADNGPQGDARQLPARHYASARIELQLGRHQHQLALANTIQRSASVRSRGVSTRASPSFTGWRVMQAAARPLSPDVETRSLLAFRSYPFFEHLAPEGWLRGRQARAGGTAEQDDFGLLLHYGADCRRPVVRRF
ncbi:HipA N-terminal domain-containing protein [Sphingomonas sp. BIUV-7]|uniref:HipA N-terminal domain-containing protein n=1 Tax=Sphingomonas natans TaxID=3063330 RepID=A0ABT8Y7Q6_9SPHN|nr:HipA N-terminal domain-containing protein [Sphingomonas sp. BIUV-7]MDO6414347.1 HipA N-terminal domain-containing protein [Sphingomonas sp. BIUV-7]